ncbi:MAG TPA: alpha-L-arabinofuranosidase C-terminal domain-containing protein [Terriglobales bacterium]
MMERREFLRHAAVATGGLMVFRSPISALSATTSAPCRIEVLPGEELGTISPTIYGHFTENLSGVIYDGIWVGKNSKVPNVDGIRSELVEHMRKIKPAVIRFPGGCFADSYDWRDGVGPAEKRPRRTNFWDGAEGANSPASHRYDPNQFGTDEFVHFCKLTGGQPYLAANVRSLPAEEFDRWVEYCNSPKGSTTLADLRAAGGSPEPFDVRYWGVGNESWGCGGNFLPQEYATEFRRYAAWVPGYGKPLSLIASGPNSDDLNWTRGFFEALARKGKDQINSVYGFAVHHYAWNLARGKTQDWDQGKGDALKFDAVDWYELLREGQKIEDLIDGHWREMGEIDTEHHVKLVVDEWGPWYKSGSEQTPGDALEQTPTLRDAVFSGMTLDIFNRNPERVAMANCAQLINCLNSLYLAHEDKFVVTPVGRVFEMYVPHQGGKALRASFSSPPIQYDRDGKPAEFWGLRGSASVHGKSLVLTVVNPSVAEPRETEISFAGARAKSGKITVLSHSDIHACNTFAQRETVLPSVTRLKITGPTVVHTFPPASVSTIEIELA